MLGYVQKDKIKFVETPQNPYPEDIFISLNENTNLFTKPYSDFKDISLTKNQKLLYIGSLVGEELSIFKGNIWYYVKYDNGEESEYGYVYSGYTTGVGNQNLNVENLSSIKTKDLSKISTIISVVLFIPTTIFVFMFLKKLNATK